MVPDSSGNFNYDKLNRIRFERINEEVCSPLITVANDEGLLLLYFPWVSRLLALVCSQGILRGVTTGKF